MAKKVFTHITDSRGKVKVVEEKQPSRAALRSAGGRHGDFQKDGVGSRIMDAALKRLGR